MTDQPVLVTGATGTQGGAVCSALLARGVPVRALVRNPRSAASQALAAAGAQLAAGDLDEPDSLARAVDGARAVFSVQRPATTVEDAERRHGRALVQAARSAGVQHFVHSSVARTGEHAAFPGWDAGRWSRGYWTDKLAVEDEVRASGLRWTILRPAFLMENCIPPKSTWMFPHLHEGRLVTALLPQTRLQFIAAADVAAFACAALEQPQRFDRQAIALAAEDLTMDEVAGVLARAWSRPVEAVSLAPDAAVAAGCMAPVVRSQAWSNEVSYGVDIAALRGWGLPLTSFADWARRHAPAGPA